MEDKSLEDEGIIKRHEVAVKLHPILLGKKLINNKFEEQIVDEIFGKKLLILYFTAQWCSPCTILNKDLLALYSETNQGQKLLEIIHISFDKTETAFKADISDKPWTFFTFNDPAIKELSKLFKVTHIPVLLLVDSELNIISDNCRKEITNEGPTVSERWLKDLKSKESTISSQKYI